MKSLYLTLTALALCAGVNAQIIFESNLDNWNDSVPNDWFGSKTSLEVDSASIVTTGATHGTALAELTNLENGHRRFTTQQLALEAGQTYEVEVWVKGAGEVRTNLFDGAGNNGYNTYNAYVSVTSELSSFVQTILPDTTSNEQEVIVSFRGGVIQLDRVEVRIGMAVEAVAATITEIQTPEDASGDSPFNTMPVVTSGVVTAAGNFGYYIQSGTADYSGLYVEDGNNSPSIGDEVSVTGTVEEFFDFTRINNVTAFDVLNSGVALPTPVSVGTSAVNDEKYEGMLVRTDGLCTELPNDFGEWLIDNGSGQIMVDDVYYEFTPTMGINYEVVGPLNYSFSNFKILPRDMNDVNIVSSVVELAAEAFAVFPIPATDELTISLTDATESVIIEVIDMAGRVVSAQRSADMTAVISVSALEPGQYLLRITADNKVGVRTVTVL